MRVLLLCCICTLTACASAPPNPQGWCPPIPADLLEPVPLTADRLPVEASNADAIRPIGDFERWAHDAHERLRKIKAAQAGCR